VCSRTDEIREEDIGTGAGLFEVKKIGDEYFTFITQCQDPKVMHFRCSNGFVIFRVVVVVLCNPFRGMEARKNSSETRVGKNPGFKKNQPTWNFLFFWGLFCFGLLI